jgi:hypothetical protein
MTLAATAGAQTFSDARKTAQKPASRVPLRMPIFLDAKEYSLTAKLINVQEYLFNLCSVKG